MATLSGHEMHPGDDDRWLRLAGALVPWVLITLVLCAAIVYGQEASEADTSTPVAREPVATTPSINTAPTCGEGPHKLTIRVPVACPCATSLQRAGDGSTADYFSVEHCPATTCATERTEFWSDWPECGGKQLREKGGARDEK